MLLWADLKAMVRHPSAALRAIDGRHRLWHGLLALGLALLIPASLAEIGALGPYRPLTNLSSLSGLTAQGVDIYAQWSYQHRFALPVYGMVIAAILWLVAAGLIHLVVRALHGRGSFHGYVKLVGFIALVGLLTLPVGAVETLLRLWGNGRAHAPLSQLAGILGLGVFVWENALLVVAARVHYGVSTERAVTAVVGPLGCVVALAIGLLLVALLLSVVIHRAGPA